MFIVIALFNSKLDIYIVFGNSKGGLYIEWKRETRPLCRYGRQCVGMLYVLHWVGQITCTL